MLVPERTNEERDEWRTLITTSNPTMQLLAELEDSAHTGVFFSIPACSVQNLSVVSMQRPVTWLFLISF